MWRVLSDLLWLRGYSCLFFSRERSGSMKQMLFTSSAQWRRWLAHHHTTEPGVWLVFSKAPSRLKSIEYGPALDEALCYGWIDSIIRKIDDTRYVRKFTPRKPNSLWSDINKKKASRLIRLKRMTPAGLRAIRRSQELGRWESRPRPTAPRGMPKAFRDALKRNERARAFYFSLPGGEQRRFTIWISIAKQEETRLRRIRESIRLLAHKQKLGLK